MNQTDQIQAQCKSNIERIRQVIAEAQGFISFARFMELALYHPEFGYYTTHIEKFGRTGDFVTAPEISPLFAQCFARYCQPVLSQLKSGDILELGAGTGRFAKDLLLELEKLNSLPQNYFISEISEDLRQRQYQLLAKECPHLLSRVRWLNTLPSVPITGVVIANEVLDALPFHCFRVKGNTIFERGVGFQDEKLIWCERPATAGLLEKAREIQQTYALPNQYKSEINLNLLPLVKKITDGLQQGVIIFIDYGYGQAEYYHPERISGTLKCFSQHHQHEDPILLPGMQDITAHVDFTTVAESGIACGLNLLGYTTQAAFLLATGLLDLAASQNLSTIDYYAQTQAIKKLTLPTEMGEVVKVMGFAKQFDGAIMGFELQDRRRDLG